MFLSHGPKSAGKALGLSMAISLEEEQEGPGETAARSKCLLSLVPSLEHGHQELTWVSGP